MYNFIMQSLTHHEWVRDLSSISEKRFQAETALSAMLLCKLPLGLARIYDSSSLSLDDFIEEITRDTIEIVSQNLSSYTEQIPFTTWVIKIAVRQMLLKLRLRRWLEKKQNGSLPEITPEMYNLLSQNKVLQYAHKIFKEELNQNQRTALRAMVMFRMPKEEVMKHLGMERCNYFRMIHDAQLLLKRRIESEEWLQQEENGSLFPVTDITAYLGLS